MAEVPLRTLRKLRLRTRSLPLCSAFSIEAVDHRTSPPLGLDSANPLHNEYTHKQQPDKSQRQPVEVAPQPALNGRTQPPQ
jgi:hypothetical protein